MVGLFLRCEVSNGKAIRCKAMVNTSKAVRRVTKLNIKQASIRTVQWDAKNFNGGIWLQVPFIPPSLNEWSRWHWARQHQYKKDLYNAVRMLALAAKLPKYDKATVQIVYYFSDRRRRDKDNYNGKFLLDSLRQAEVILEDNSEVLDLPEPMFAVDIKRPRTEIFIWPR